MQAAVDGGSCGAGGTGYKYGAGGEVHQQRCEPLRELLPVAAGGSAVRRRASGASYEEVEDTAGAAKEDQCRYEAVAACNGGTRRGAEMVRGAKVVCDAARVGGGSSRVTDWRRPGCPPAGAAHRAANRGMCGSSGGGCCCAWMPTDGVGGDGAGTVVTE